MVEFGPDIRMGGARLVSGPATTSNNDPGRRNARVNYLPYALAGAMSWNTLTNSDSSSPLAHCRPLLFPHDRNPSESLFELYENPGIEMITILPLALRPFSRIGWEIHLVLRCGQANTHSQ